jgi:hypothetical protein
MTTDCLKKKVDPAVAAFNIKLPPGYYCSDVTLSVDKNVMGSDDDRSRFIPLLTHTTIGNNNTSAALAIAFTPPGLQDHYNSKHSNIYECDFVVNETYADGTVHCTQEIQLKVNVFEFSFTMGDVIPMQAFSQISAADKNPSYHVYDIDEYNSTLGNYGLRESLTPAFVNYSTTPNTPMSNHTLFFDVDSPDDTVANFTQLPKLFLINTPGNNFSRISAVPVATYDTPNDFFNNYESGNLMNQVMGSSIDKYNFNYTPYRSKDQFLTMGGLSIHPYEVYIVWDPSAAPDHYTTSTGQQFISCGMALIYISSVKSGEENFSSVTGGNGKASVSFYVVYPVKY